MIFITVNNEKKAESISELCMFASPILCSNLEFIGWTKSLNNCGSIYYSEDKMQPQGKVLLQWHLIAGDLR